MKFFTEELNSAMLSRCNTSNSLTLSIFALQFLFFAPSAYLYCYLNSNKLKKNPTKFAKKFSGSKAKDKYIKEIALNLVMLTDLFPLKCFSPMKDFYMRAGWVLDEVRLFWAQCTWFAQTKKGLIHSLAECTDFYFPSQLSFTKNTWATMQCHFKLALTFLQLCRKGLKY